MSDETQAALKPCPFCGHAAIDSYETNDNWYSVYCVVCGIHTADCKSIEAAIDNWNTRPAEDALRATIATLQAEPKGHPAQFEGEL